MNAKIQRIKIAEVCRWKPAPEPNKFWIVIGSNRGETAHDPLSDLNAMHETEKVLSKERPANGGMFSEQTQRYHSHLVTLTTASKWDSYIPAVHATAAQRAEAFLKTLNLWT